MEYVDILLLENGVFCLAPSWDMEEGDFVCLPDCTTGKNKVLEVISVATDKVDGDFVTMVNRYVGYPLPKVTAKYKRTEVEWNEPVHE